MNDISVITKELLRAIIVDQRVNFLDQTTGVDREVLSKLKKIISSSQITIITGLRRVGKSTLLAQIAKTFFKKNNFYYLSFEDERLAHFSINDFELLYQVLLEEHGEQSYFFLDEIQNIPQWERFVRRMHDRGYNFIVTGSNASLLSRELGTRLTGRYVQIDLFPFSFKEYLLLHRFEIGTTTKDKAALERHLKKYLSSGGIPNAILYPELNIHQSLYNDVVYRDIVARYNLENATSIKELGSYLLSNIASLISYNKLKELLKLGSVTTVKNYIDYFKDSWLFFIVNKYAYSIKEQSIAGKKIYGIDNGLVSSLGFSFSPNTGRLMENLVYLQLKRQNIPIYYYKTKTGKEVDFYLPTKSILIQVSLNIDNIETLERELSALTEAAAELETIGNKVKCQLITLYRASQNTNIINKVETFSLSEYLLL